MNKDQAIALAVKICEDQGRRALIDNTFVRRGEEISVVVPLDEEGDEMHELQLQVLKAEGSETFIVAEQTGGGRGDPQSKIHTGQAVFTVW